MSSSPFVRWWVFILIVLNFFIPLIFIQHPLAWIVIGVFFLNALFMVILTYFSGFSRLLGLGHFPWFLLMIYLFRQAPALYDYPYLLIWVRLLILVNLASLIIDTIDVARWLWGERKEMV